MGNFKDKFQLVSFYSNQKINRILTNLTVIDLLFKLADQASFPYSNKLHPLETQ